MENSVFYCHYCNVEKAYIYKDDLKCNICSNYICDDCMRNGNRCFMTECKNCENIYCTPNCIEKCNCRSDCIYCL